MKESISPARGLNGRPQNTYDSSGGENDEFYECNVSASLTKQNLLT